ncbi:hypothetical protein [Phenylobacterium deserti]|nr:hypothetical protein [Phenylobacterium deserti]
MNEQIPGGAGQGGSGPSGAAAPSTGQTGQGVSVASPGHDIGGVGGSSAIGGGLGSGESRGNAAGTGLGDGATGGEALNDLGVASGGMGSDGDQGRTDLPEDARELPPGPGASGERA